MSTKTILVAGRSGQVAQSLVEEQAAYPGFEVIAEGRPDLDITSRESVNAALRRHQPDLVINAAAYTAVDKAEEDRDAAFAGNEEGPKHLAEATAAEGLPLIHLSTDYVFNGAATSPYQITDTVAPLGVYGASKLAGEQAVAAANPQHIIIRTAWIYGAYGKNFLKTMLRVAASRDELNVVADQTGAPTSSHDLATALLRAAPMVLATEVPWGVYHLAARGEATWADFAEAIFTASAELGGPSAQVNRITTADYPTPAARPAYSVLDTSAWEKAFGFALPQWQGSVPDLVRRVLEEED